MAEALYEVVFFLNAMVETNIIPHRLCGDCAAVMVATPISIDLNSGGPPWRETHIGHIPRWICNRCTKLDPVSTDHFLMALDYRADAMAYQSKKRPPINRRNLEISLMLRSGERARL